MSEGSPARRSSDPTKPVREALIDIIRLPEPERRAALESLHYRLELMLRIEDGDAPSWLDVG